MLQPQHIASPHSHVPEIHFVSRDFATQMGAQNKDPRFTIFHRLLDLSTRRSSWLNVSHSSLISGSVCLAKV